MRASRPNKFILTGTGPRAGRTTVGCALAFAFKVRGLRVGVMKPAATGCAERAGVLAPDAAAAMLAAASSDLPLELAAPYHYRAPFAPLEAARIDGVAPPDFAVIDRALTEIEESSDTVIVEDTHGLDARLDPAHDFADLALAHRLEPIVVVAHRPGFAEAARHAIDFARACGLKVRGMILNAVEPGTGSAVDHDARSLALGAPAPMLGVLHFKEPLSLAIVAQLL